VYARAPARETLLLRARCTSARETLRDDSSKACGQPYDGVFFEFRARREESADLARNRDSRRSRTPLAAESMDAKNANIEGSAWLPEIEIVALKALHVQVQVHILYLVRNEVRNYSSISGSTFVQYSCRAIFLFVLFVHICAVRVVVLDIIYHIICSPSFS
jgi:hypothetical protein